MNLRKDHNRFPIVEEAALTRLATHQTERTAAIVAAAKSFVPRQALQRRVDARASLLGYRASSPGLKHSARRTQSARLGSSPGRTHTRPGASAHTRDESSAAGPWRRDYEPGVGGVHTSTLLRARSRTEDR